MEITYDKLFTAYPVISCAGRYLSPPPQFLYLAGVADLLSAAVDQHKIVFSNFNGGGFGDNARYIAEECIRRKIPYKLYWVCSNPALPFPKELNLVPPNTAAFVYHMATAGCWVDTTRKLYYFKKKKNQTYIHTWHAGPGLKKIERDGRKRTYR